jgi:hypothetical protein
MNRASRPAWGAATRDLSTSRHNVEDLAGRHLVVGADRLGGVQVAASGEDRQPCEQAALVLEQQVVAPVHHRPKGLLAGKGRAGTHGEQPEAVVEPFRQGGQLRSVNRPGEKSGSRQRAPGIRTPDYALYVKPEHGRNAAVRRTDNLAGETT